MLYVLIPILAEGSASMGLGAFFGVSGMVGARVTYNGIRHGEPFRDFSYFGEMTYYHTARLFGGTPPERLSRQEKITRLQDQVQELTDMLSNTVRGTYAVIVEKELAEQNFKNLEEESKKTIESFEALVKKLENDIEGIKSSTDFSADDTVDIDLLVQQVKVLTEQLDEYKAYKQLYLDEKEVTEKWAEMFDKLQKAANRANNSKKNQEEDANTPNIKI